MNGQNIRAMRALRARRAQHQRLTCERMQQRQEMGGKLLPRTVVIEDWHRDETGCLSRRMGAES